MVASINDPLNLKDYISFVADFIKKHGSSDLQPRTLVKFLSITLDGITGWEKPSDEEAQKKMTDPLVVSLQRMFSGNIPYANNAKVSELSAQIIRGEHDTDLTNNLALVVDAIAKTDREQSFYTQLSQLVSLRFFLPQKKTTSIH